MNRLEIVRFPRLDSSGAEAMNSLCTKLSYCGSDVKAIMITSRYEKEGKSFLTMNLWRSLAGLQKRVVMLDADLRKSSVRGRFRPPFNESRPEGLAQYLAGACPMENIIYETNIPNAYIVPAGGEAANALQLLNAPGMAALMDELKKRFDVVLVDTPALGVVIDAMDIAKHCDGALIVVSYKRGRNRDIAEIREIIDKTECRMLGAVMNNVKFNSLSSRHYYYRSERYALRCHSQDAAQSVQGKKKKRGLRKKGSSHE